LWDLDGTLVHLRVAPTAVDGWRIALAAHFAPMGWEHPFRPLLPGLESALAWLARHDPASARATAELVYAELDARELADTLAIEPIHPTVRHFAYWMAQGVASAIVTNNGLPVAEQAVDVLDRGPGAGLAARPAHGRGSARRTAC
jgi:hypothetical protein